MDLFHEIILIFLSFIPLSVFWLIAALKSQTFVSFVVLYTDANEHAYSALKLCAYPSDERAIRFSSKCFS